MDPEHHWKWLPGRETVRSAEELSGTGPGQAPPGVAFLPEGATRYLARTVAGDLDADVDGEEVKNIRVLTAAEVAGSLRVVWEEYLERWG